MYKALIIEDEQKLSEALLLLLRSVVPDQVTVMGIAAQVADAVHLINTVQPDLVFMDIQLKNGTAFQILDQLVFKEFHLIFTTAYQQYAIRAFKYSAIDYLLKPIDATELKNAVERIAALETKYTHPVQIQQLQHNLHISPDRISLPTMAGIHVVLLCDIIRCETLGSYTTFHTTNGEKIMVSRPLKSYDEILLLPRFFRIHQSHTVNLDFIKTYSKAGILTLKDDTVLPVAQRKKEAFLKLIRQKSASQS